MLFQNLSDSAGLKALDWVNRVCEIIGGRGGGKDLFAQATCDNILRIQEALDFAKKFAELKINA